MRGIVLALFLAALLTGCGRLEASEASDLHKTAHFFGSYSVNIASYGMWKAILKPDNKLAAILLGAATTAVVCAAKEATDKSFSGRDMAVCGAGVGASTLTILTFGF